MKGTASGDFDCLGIHRCCIVLEVSSPLTLLGGVRTMGHLRAKLANSPILPSVLLPLPSTIIVIESILRKSPAAVPPAGRFAGSYAKVGVQ